MPESALADCCELVVGLFSRVVVYQLHAGDQTALATLALRAADLASALLGPEHPDTLTARGNLASSYYAAGRTTEAIGLSTVT